jgi:phytoene/squalene synthetase
MMTSTSAKLARSITWASSKQSYLTARLLADRDLADDCLRAYAYFRWADDRIDICLSTNEACAAFIEREKNLINSLYQGRRPDDLLPEETMLADLIAHDRSPESGLGSFIRNFMSVIEFDAHRKGCIASRRELAAYTSCLAAAVMDGLQYFIGNRHVYPRTHNRNLAVTGAHITHMLRDTLEDFSNGLVNIPSEDLAAYALDPGNLDSGPMRRWVHDQVELAKLCFQEGKTYIDSLEVLRCQLAGVWYCARFECILQAIERDGYRLQAEYPQRHSLRTWLEMARRGIVITFKFVARRIRLFFQRLDQPANLDSTLNMSSYHIKKA